MEKKKEEMFDERKNGRSRKSGRKKSSASNLPYIAMAATALILTAGAGLGFYFAKSGAYHETFMPNTTINGIEVAGMDVDAVKAVVEAELDRYELKILDRTGAGETITRDEINLHTEFDGGLEQILELQEPIKWIKSLWTEVDYRIGTMLVYDEQLLDEKIRGLSIMNPEKMSKPKNAYLSDYQFDTNRYEIIAPTEGTELVEAQVRSAIADAVLNLQDEVDLDAAGCYTEAEILEEDPKLTALAAELNRYAGVSITYRLDDLQEVLDGDTIHQWLTVEGDAVNFDESKVTEYVKTLARKYNTAYEKRPFRTTYGEVVTIPGGSYGWRMNQTAEVEAILEAIREGAVRTREPQWLQEGASHGEYDYGDTYVEVNLTGQHLFFYKDGVLMAECDFVSGNAAKGWSTPAGIFPLTYKQRNATLRGENYATPVSYWMPFNGNIGLHDADWRETFGGAIYKTNGSHGCVNLPPKAAKIIFEHIEKGDPIVCYHLEGTETKTTTKAGEVNTSGVASVIEPEYVPEVKPTETKPTETKPTETKPAETKPAETKPTETKPAETQPMETLPVETLPAETPSPIPEGVQTETAPQAPQGAVTETRPAGPGGSSNLHPDTVQRPEGASPQVAPEGSNALTETRPAGFGPGSSGEPTTGPGNGDRPASGPGSIRPDFGGPGSAGPGGSAAPQSQPMGPGY